MRKRVRVALQIAALFSCLVFLGLWVRSHRTVDILSGSVGRHYLEVATIPTQFRLSWADAWRPMPWQHWTRQRDVPSDRPILGQSLVRVWLPLAVGVRHDTFSVLTPSPAGVTRIVRRYHVVAIPFGLLAGAFGLVAWLPMLFHQLRRRRSLARRAAGRCGECGYDLRANHTGRCPECGDDATAPAAVVMR